MLVKCATRLAAYFHSSGLRSTFSRANWARPGRVRRETVIYLALTVALVALSISQRGHNGSCHAHDGAVFHCHD
jgi:5'-deoxynucleotidase YfbR-like HD superfamily hydrolase